MCHCLFTLTTKSTIATHTVVILSEACSGCVERNILSEACSGCVERNILSEACSGWVERNMLSEACSGCVERNILSEACSGCVEWNKMFIFITRNPFTEHTITVISRYVCVF